MYTRVYLVLVRYTARTVLCGAASKSRHSDYDSPTSRHVYISSLTAIEIYAQTTLSKNTPSQIVKSYERTNIISENTRLCNRAYSLLNIRMPCLVSINRPSVCVSVYTVLGVSGSYILHTIFLDYRCARTAVIIPLLLFLSVAGSFTASVGEGYL